MTPTPTPSPCPTQELSAHELTDAILLRILGAAQRIADAVEHLAALTESEEEWDENPSST